MMDVAVGDGLLERVIDLLGRPRDDCAPVTVPLPTGLTVIDALIPVGRGQREWILGDRQTPARPPWRSTPFSTNATRACCACIVPSVIREYLFVSIFRACAESLAAENASRPAAMQRVDKNIDELLEELDRRFHRLRQSSIDEELFDVISGFEALDVEGT